MVKVKFSEQDGKIYKFLVENVDTTLLNVFRRLANYNVPTYAIDTVDFFENDSIIVDEMLANRIGLCPVATPLDNTGKKITFSLDKVGPCTVYSKDLISNDSDSVMVCENIPLTKLTENQKLNLEAFAILGQGKDHVKFCPSIIAYRQLVDFENLKGCTGCEICLNACPKNNIEMVKGKPKIIDISNCDACRACVDSCPSSSLKLVYTDNFILNIELIGQTKINDLIKKTGKYSKEYFSLLKKKFK